MRIGLLERISEPPGSPQQISSSPPTRSIPTKQPPSNAPVASWPDLNAKGSWDDAARRDPLGMLSEVGGGFESRISRHGLQYLFNSR